MTLDRTKPVGLCSAQELAAALMLQGRFNNFDPDQVLADLDAHRELWISFLMQPPLHISGFFPFGTLITLRDLPRRWHADMLYVLTQEQACIQPLVELSRSWCCDEIEVIDSDRAGTLISRSPASPIVAFWWDG